VATILSIEEPATAAELSAGVARIDLTPPLEMNSPLGGYGERMNRPAEGVHDQIVFDETVFDSNPANRIIDIQLGNLVLTDRVTITGPSTGFVFINDASATADTGLTFSGFDNIASL